jgi:hypothetical protein
MRDLLGGPEFGQPKPVQSRFMSNHRVTLDHGATRLRRAFRDMPLAAIRSPFVPAI